MVCFNVILAAAKDVKDRGGGGGREVIEAARKLLGCKAELSLAEVRRAAEL